MGMFKHQIIEQDEFHLDSYDDYVDSHDDGFGDCIEFDTVEPLVSTHSYTLEELLNKFASRGQGELPTMDVDYYNGDTNHLYL